ncbi:MAG TPA: hypothetical protein VFR03_01640 [Thermoanaerobaculia bacterium]|nr:hypothetical protein [Thermoanaerobaculia bacterium]
MNRIASALLLTVLAAVLWRIFFPALMSYDSVGQLRQAWTGVYDNWHPPLMAIVLHGFIKAGRNVGAVMLAQCLAGLFSVRALVLAGLEAFFGPEISRRRAEGIAVAAVLLLLLPVSPLPFYLATFWKDTWAAVLMLWACAFALRLLIGPPEARVSGRTWLRIAVLTAVAAALGMVRHNAVVALPFAGLAIAFALRRSSRALAVAMAAVPLLVSLGAEAALERAFHVQDSHLERHMMAFDLVGICALDARACDRLPFIKSYILAPDYRERYVPGNMALSFWTDPPLLNPEALWFGDRLRAEYLRAVRELPGLLARVKLQAFLPLLGAHGPHMLIYQALEPNELGLRLNPRFAPVRARLGELTVRSGESLLLRWISGVHLVWIAAAVLWIAALLASPGRRPLALAVLLPLSFALSYLLAAPARDYRFLYPTTLAMQAMTLAWLLGLALRGRRRGPAPLLQ